MKIYEGSVKNLWESGPGALEFEFTDAYSVFDWGRMPDELHGKGAALTRMGEFFFGYLGAKQTWIDLSKSKTWEDSFTFHSKSGFSNDLAAELEELKLTGLQHHFLERSADNRLRVRKVRVERPRATRVMGQTVYDYSGAPVQAPQLIPLEVVFRFGAPKGSSFIDRCTPEYSRTLGLIDSQVREGSRFAGVILECFTKLEPGDRFLDLERAMSFSKLPPELFRKMLARSALAAMALGEFFTSRGLELWDGKFEWATSEGGGLWLVDSVGPDELRLLDPVTGAQFSKEFLRQYYRESDWAKKLSEEKRRGGEWKKRMLVNGESPPALPGEWREIASRLYPSIAAWVTGQDPTGKAMALSDMRSMIDGVLK